MRPSVEIKLTAEERSELERLARGRKVWRGLADRAQIVLLAAEGRTNVPIGNGAGPDRPDRQEVAQPVCRAPTGRAFRRASLRPAAAHR